MIRHIFKIIWNERKSNIWITAEYILIFCVLWFCCDYIFTMFKTYKKDPGFDITHTYMIKMGEKADEKKEGEKNETDRYGLALTFLDRIKHHPEIEYVTLGTYSIPYSGSISYEGIYTNSDSIEYNLRKRKVTSDFFKVFDIKLKSGRIFDWQDEKDKDCVIISALESENFGSYWLPPIPISQIQTIRIGGKEGSKKVIGTTGHIMDAYWGTYTSTTYHPLSKNDVNLFANEIAVRIKPGAEKDFSKRFRNEMKEQLNIGPYYLASVEPISKYKEKLADRQGITGKMNNVYAITGFLAVNIFLGILGTFWFRTQARKSEIGLRISMGATKQNVRNMFIYETLFILTLAGAIGTVICLNFVKIDLINTLGIPSVNRQEWAIGNGQDIINFILTYSFLAIVSVFAVWYPAKRASEIQPAQALKEE